MSSPLPSWSWNSARTWTSPTYKKRPSVDPQRPLFSWRLSMWWRGSHQYQETSNPNKDLAAPCPSSEDAHFKQSHLHGLDYEPASCTQSGMIKFPPRQDTGPVQTQTDCLVRTNLVIIFSLPWTKLPEESSFNHNKTHKFRFIRDPINPMAKIELTSARVLDQRTCAQSSERKISHKGNVCE